MNKLFTKIVGVALGATMAIGVGVAVASNREIKQAYGAFGDVVVSGDFQSSTSSHDNWTTSHSDYYSGNGFKMKAVGNNVSSPSFANQNLKNIKVGIKAGYNGNAGSVFTIYALDTNGDTLSSGTVTPAVTYTTPVKDIAEQFVYLSSTQTIASINIEMTTKVSNCGLKIVNVYDDTPAVTPEVSSLELVYDDPLVLDGENTETTASASILYEVKYTSGKEGDGAILIETSSDNLIAEDDENGTITLSSSVEGDDYTVTITTVDKKSNGQPASETINVTVQNILVPEVETYSKITEDQDDWEGEYLLVYEASSSSAYCWTGVDTSKSSVSASIKDNKIEKPDGAVTLSVVEMTGGYSVQVNGGTNDGKYIYGSSGSNKTNFGDSAVLNTITYDSGVLLTSNTSVMRFNSASDQLWFRYYKSKTYTSQKVVQLYKLDGGTPTTTIQLAASDVNMELGADDVLPVVTNASTHETISGWEYDTTSTDLNVASILNGKIHAAGAGTTTIKITHPDGEGVKYKPVTINVSVITVESIQTIVTACAAIEGNTGVISGTHTIQGTVTGIYGHHFMIQQGDYGMYVYTGSGEGTDYGVSLNDVVRVTGTFGKYNKWIETRSISSVTKIQGATPETITPYHASSPSSLTDLYQNRLITFTGLTWVNGTYTPGTGTSITFKDASENTVYLRTDAAVDDLIEAEIAKKIKAISDDEGKTLVTDLVGVHYTVFYSGGTTQQQFKVTNEEKISYRSKEATDEQIVDQFVNDKLKWNTYDPDHREGVDGDHECLGADGYYMNAKNAFTTQLTEKQQNLFRHIGEYASQEDKYAAPRRRYEAWALAYGDTTPYGPNVTPKQGAKIINDIFGDSAAVTVVTIVTSAIALTAIGGYFFIRRRKHN